MSRPFRFLPLRFILSIPIFLLTCNISWAQTPLNFVSVTPCRVADTRFGGGPFGGPSITGGTIRDFPIPQGTCGIPSTAWAYSLNFTVVPHGRLGYLTVWPTGLAQPVVSTLNSPDGRVKANAAIVPAGSSGAVSAFVTDTTDLVIDINGYFVTDTSQLAFYPLTPCRVLDTRNSSGPLGSPSMQANQQRDFPIMASNCGLPTAALAYSLNFTVVPQRTLGYLSVWPSGGQRPVVSTLNSSTGAITANAAIVPAGTNGEISAYVTDETDVVADINGYFAPPGSGGQSLYAFAPCRILDTRQSSGAFSGTQPVNIAGAPCALPGGISAYVFNSTVVPQGELGYLTLWPDGESQPVVSTLNALDGAITSNMAIVPTSNGSVDAFTTNTSDLILDAFSYFATPEPPSPQGVYTGSTSTGLTFETIILPNNMFYGIYGGANSDYFFGLVTGQGNFNDSTFNATITDYYEQNGGSITGSFAPGSSITGTLVEPGVITETFSGTAIPISRYNYNTTAVLSNITGNWTGIMQDGTIALITIDPDGTFTGSNNGCSFLGTIIPESSNKNFYNVSLTFGGSPCPLGYPTANGIAVDYLLSNGVTHQLLLGATSGSVIVFVATPGGPGTGMFSLSIQRDLPYDAFLPDFAYTDDDRIICPWNCSATYKAGSSVTLGATTNSAFTFAGWSGGGCSGTGSCTVTINAATNIKASWIQPSLVSIAVTPTNVSLPVGISQQFKAIGTYPDGSTRDITLSVTWSASPGAAINLDGFGKATAMTPGTVNITATYGNSSGAATMTVAGP
jgi:hypothetical protein